MDAIQLGLLEQVADLHGVPEGAYNIRSNGQGIARNSTANIEIAPKQDKPGIDIIMLSAPRTGFVSTVIACHRANSFLVMRFSELSRKSIRQR